MRAFAPKWLRIKGDDEEEEKEEEEQEEKEEKEEEEEVVGSGVESEVGVFLLL